MLPVIHVHLGPSLPPHYWDTVRQTRRFHSGPILRVIPPEAMGAPELEELAVKGILNTRWEGATAVRRLREVSWLNSVYGANGFWHYTLERLFVLAELMREEGLHGFFIWRTTSLSTSIRRRWRGRWSDASASTAQ